MITPNDIYKDRLKEKDRRPVYYVTFGAVGDGSLVVALPDEYATAHIYLPTKTRETWLYDITGVSQGISTLAGTSTIGQLSFKLLDRDSKITKLISSYPMKNRTITLYGGFAGLPEEFYFPIFVGCLNNINLSSDGTSWIFTATDFQRLEKQTVFANKARLATTMLSTDLECQFNTTTGFAPHSESGTSLGECFFVKIDDEVIGYESMSGGSVKGLRRGLHGTTAEDHDYGAEVVNFTILDGNPIDIMLWIMTSTGASQTGGTLNGDYDLLPASMGCGISTTYIDIAHIEEQRDSIIGADKRMRFYMFEETEAKDFIQKEILKVLNSYPTIRPDGKLSIKAYSAPLRKSTLPSFDDSNIVGMPRYSQNMQSQSTFFNEVQIKMDFNPLAGEFDTEYYALDSESQAKTQEAAQLVIESKGLRSSYLYKGVPYVNEYSGKVFHRFSKGAPGVQVEVFYDNHLIEVGDLVSLDTLTLPNLLTGERTGLNLVCEVIEKSYNFPRGTITFSLLATEYQKARKYFIIAPNDVPDYSSSTTAQKEYGFIGKSLTTDVCVQNDGSLGSYIAP